MAYQSIAANLQGYGVFIASQAANFIFALIVVLIFLFIGYVVAKVIAHIVLKGLQRIRLEEWIREKGLEGALAGFSLSKLVLLLIKVYVIFAFLGAAAEIINVSFFRNIIAALLAYMPSLAQGMIIIVATLFVAAYIARNIRAEKKLFFSEQIALGVQLLLGYIAIILALPLLLPNLGEGVLILKDLLNLIVTAIIIAFGLGVGLALGLGLKDSISKAAAKNQAMFDNFFAKFGKKM